MKVFYCHRPDANEIGKEGFGKAFNWDVDLLTGYEYEFLENYSTQPSLSSFNGCDTPQIGERVAEFGATHVVVFGWYLKSFIQILNYCNKNGIPIAARGDSQLDPDLFFLKRIAKKIYYPHFLRKYSAFLYVGQRNKDYLKYYGVAEEKLIFSPHAVDQEFWKATAERPRQEKFVFLWVGKFIEKKRPLDVLQAFRSAFQKSSHVLLKMVGTGALHADLKEQFRDEKNIHFLDFKNQTELRKEYLNANCLVLSSDYKETWGLVVNEAMSCGMPCIVSDACGCSPDMVEVGKNGLIYKMGDLSELKNRLIEMRENYASIANEGYIASKNEMYSYQRNALSFQELLKKF